MDEAMRRNVLLGLSAAAVALLAVAVAVVLLAPDSTPLLLTLLLAGLLAVATSQVVLVAMGRRSA